MYVPCIHQETVVNKQIYHHWIVWSLTIRVAKYANTFSPREEARGLGLGFV